MSTHDPSTRAAVLSATYARRERRRRLLVGSLIGAIFLTAMAALAWSTARSESSPAPLSSAVPVRVVDSHLVIGQDSAPTRVVIYEDFQCPFCREFERATRGVLQEGAAEGRLRVEYRPFNLLTELPYSGRALDAYAAVLQHGKPRQVFALHALLFDKQPYENDSAIMTSARIAELVAEAGATQASVTAALGAPSDRAFVDREERLAEIHKVAETPTVMINGRPFTGSDLNDAVAAIERAVKSA